MPKIPVNMADLPREYEPMDSNVPYHVIIKSCSVSDAPDKNGSFFLTGIKAEVMAPEESKGRFIYANYIPLPRPMSPGMSDAERREALEAGVPFARFVDGFKVPYDDEGVDPVDAIGCEGDVMIQVEEFQGKPIPRIANVLL